MAEVVAVIPARFGSQRFPGKALAAETGRPLIQHVYEQAAGASCVSRVIVATDDDRIVDAVREFGGEAALTQHDHENGTSRIAEVAESLDADLIVNVQGDEPEIDPALIDAAVRRLTEAGDDAPVGTLASRFAPSEDPLNPNIVKVVVDRNDRALYFSRALIPHDRDGTGEPHPLKHIGLYVYRRAFLEEYVFMPVTPLERIERLEQLRILENGYAIVVGLGEAHHHGIDTPEQYAQFVRRWRERPR